MRRPYAKHGLNTLKRAAKELGERAIDGRTAIGKTLRRWRSDLITDLGGPGVVSTQQVAIVDLAVKTKLLVDSIDAWLFAQHTLVNARKRTLLPVILQRQQLADSLARYLNQLGLEKRRARVPDLHEYLRARRHGDRDPNSGSIASHLPRVPADPS
jgi:hypothetical protein